MLTLQINNNVSFKNCTFSWLNNLIIKPLKEINISYKLNIAWLFQIKLQNTFYEGIV